MSMICDSCKQPLVQDDGYGQIRISDPTFDYRSGKTPTFRTPPQIDLCSSCLLKMIGALGLPPDTFVPRPPPPPAPPPLELAGALTPEDLVALGLDKEGA